ncbi:hypothetical protein HJFPF1_12767 [Paramyrothecium foliicola]|nr:hypothetical protein HJFPF1_12767 [Paramyrothecium foliicola]
MTSAAGGIGENDSQAAPPFIVLHEASHERTNTLNAAEGNPNPASGAPPSPSASSNLSSSHGAATTELSPTASTPQPSAPRADKVRPERPRVEKGSKLTKLEKRNAMRQQASDDQRKPDVWSYLANSPAGGQSPVQGAAHTRQGSYPDQSYAGPLAHPQANPYQSPPPFNNAQRSDEDWAPNNWNGPYGAPGVSPSALTFDGHFPQGPQQPPFPNGPRPPDMARGPSSTASFSPIFVQTNFPGPNGIHGPPFGRPPLSGYELLAAKLSGSLGGPPIKPIYRRFEALNHRLMLHLQDELAELEEQLHALDALDTQARQHPGGVFPASRRQDSPNPNAPSAQRTDLLGRIGYKICQYHQVVTSFRELQELEPPSMPDIQEYRTYLAAGHPVVEDEARFLDLTDDLIELNLARDAPPEPFPEPMYTPMARSSVENAGFPPSHHNARATEGKPAAPSAAVESRQAEILNVMTAISVAVVAPILTFLIIPSFSGRLTVALLIWSGACTVLLQSGSLKLLIKDGGVTECTVATIVYLVAMTIIASGFN